MRFQATSDLKARVTWVLLAIAGCMAAQGCTICCQPYLEDYAAFGSRTPRTDMKTGRVGSPFSDPALQGNVITTSEAETYQESKFPSELSYETPPAISFESSSSGDAQHFER